MYKVFVNTKTLLLVTAPQENVGAEAVCDERLTYKGPSTVRRTVDLCFSDDTPGTICLQSPDEDALWNEFRGFFHALPAAGGIVTDARGRLLMIHRKGYWDLPKGKVDDGETTQAAALREVCEETGVCDLRILSSPESTWHAYRLRKKDVLKETAWFRMACGRFGGFALQGDEGIDDAGWFTRDEVKARLPRAYPLIRELVQGAGFGV